MTPEYRKASVDEVLRAARAINWAEQDLLRELAEATDDQMIDVITRWMDLLCPPEPAKNEIVNISNEPPKAH